MTPQKGLTLGSRYELQQRIAIGGMGEVWTAADQHLTRIVAAKVLRTEFAGDDSFLNRMRAEARNTAGLSHINVTAMYDYGEQDGTSYLIMEYVEGEPLSDLLARERTLPPEQLIPILAQTARGLHAAHVAGVVHRDVKPSNLLITRDGTVKITDFGIALGANQAPMTAAGMVMGTAQYLPPEQAMGKSAQGVGDIYALGIIGYEALAGKRPFTGSTQVDIAFAHVNQPVPDLPDSVHPQLREVIMSMLRKDPEQRPRSGASLARTLEDLLERHHHEESPPTHRSPGHRRSPTPSPASAPSPQEAASPAAVDGSAALAWRPAPTSTALDELALVDPPPPDDEAAILAEITLPSRRSRRLRDARRPVPLTPVAASPQSQPLLAHDPRPSGGAVAIPDSPEPSDLTPRWRPIPGASSAPDSTRTRRSQHTRKNLHRRSTAQHKPWAMMLIIVALIVLVSLIGVLIGTLASAHAISGIAFASLISLIDLPHAPHNLEETE